MVSGYVSILQPKPPPTSPAMTRTLFSGKPRTSTTALRSRWGPGGEPQGQVAGAAFVAGHHGPGFQGARDEAGLDQARRDHAVGLTEGAVGLASPPRDFDAEIGAQIRVDQGAPSSSAFSRSITAGSVSYSTSIMARASCATTTGGHHRRHGLSRILRDRRRHGPSALGVHAVPDASEAKLPLTMVLDLVSGQHRQHARLLPGSRGINPTEVGVGVRAAEHGHVRHAAELHVIGIFPFAGEEAGSFRLMAAPISVDPWPAIMAGPPYAPMVFVADTTQGLENVAHAYETLFGLAVVRRLCHAGNV